MIRLRGSRYASSLCPAFANCITAPDPRLKLAIHAVLFLVVAVFLNGSNAYAQESLDWSSRGLAMCVPAITLLYAGGFFKNKEWKIPYNATKTIIVILMVIALFSAFFSFETLNEAARISSSY